MAIHGLDLDLFKGGDRVAMSSGSNFLLTQSHIHGQTRTDFIFLF